MTRQTKTPTQRAHEALGVAERKVKKLRGVVAVLEKHLRENKAELDEAERLLAYAKQHPALQSTTPTKEEGTA